MADNGANNPDDVDVFVYMGEGMIVPNDVVRARVHPSVTVIPANAFMNCRRKLEEVELPDGLLEIGECAFHTCRALKRMGIPSTVRKIGVGAFTDCSKLEEVELCEGLLELGENAFRRCSSLKRINIPSTVTEIPDHEFAGCRQLGEVELCEGLLEIGDSAFRGCRALKRLNIPSTVKHIGVWAFASSPLTSLHLPDGIEGIGSYCAFNLGKIVKSRVPPLITTIPKGMVERAESLFSAELSESVTHVESYAFACCTSLRNLSITPNASIESNDHVFCNCTDLQQLFGTYKHIINALKHRFDNLPIHKMIYYQSYESVSVDQLNDATNIRSGQRRSLRSKLDPTGKQQDCLGMTPLHILACSSVQDLESYKVLVGKYPENLITEDRWGALPLLYAVWGNAPSEVVQYLVESYHSIYPEYELDWTKMVETLGRGNVPKSTIQNLVDLQKESFPEQNIDWNTVFNSSRVSTESFVTLVLLKNLERIQAIGPKQWRDEIREFISNNARMSNRRDIITNFEAKFLHFETEYQTLKEATSMIELVLWKLKMNDRVQGGKQRRSKKKVKIEESDIREQCRIICGADIVIEHVLQYLLPAPKQNS